MKKILATAIMMVLMSGCATQTYHFSTDRPSSDVPNYDEMQPFFISGIGQSQYIDAAKICGGADRVVKIQTEESVLNYVLGSLSQSIFTPRQIRVFCK